MANLGNFVYDISGFKVRIGYPKKCFSCIDCEGIMEPSSATSLGLLISALNDQTVNCTTESHVGRIITEIETEIGKEITVEIAEIDDLENSSQESNRSEEEIETIKQEKNKGPKKPGFMNVTFTKIGDLTDKFKKGFLDFVHDISEEEPEEKA